MEEFYRGDVVKDLENSSQAMVVILTPDADLTEWDVDDDMSAADKFPAYDESENVIVVCLKESLERSLPEWRDKPKQLFDIVTSKGITFHAMPESRLDKVGMLSEYSSHQDLARAAYKSKVSGVATQEMVLEEPVTVDGTKISAVRVKRNEVELVCRDGAKITVDEVDG